jgi:hypothetical protein
MNNTCGFGAADWLRRPLCSRYSFVHFKTICVSVQDRSNAAVPQIQYWAYGTLPDEQWEVLGVRTAPSSGGVAWNEIADNLRFRGVERIRFAVGPDPLALMSGLQVQFPSVAMFQSEIGGAPAVPEQSGSFQALPLRYLGQQRRANEVANGLTRSLERSVARNGCFPSGEAASMFVANRLMLAEFCRDRAGLAAPRARCPRDARSSARLLPVAPKEAVHHGPGAELSIHLLPDLCRADRRSAASGSCLEAC